MREENKTFPIVQTKLEGGNMAQVKAKHIFCGCC